MAPKKATKPVEFITTDGEEVSFRARKHKIAPSKRSDWQKHFAKVSKQVYKQTGAAPGTKAYGKAMKMALASSETY